ncbi:MAG: DUF819 family protein [Gemmatimonadetes bacterium]|nr:DUF819 family protein [Gemmatimonadota bacterium]
MITDPTAVFFVLAAVVWVAVVLEARFAVFRSVGSAFLSIALGLVLSNAGVIPGTSPAYDFLVGPAVSAGIVLILLSVDFRTVMKAGPTMLAAFGIGALGTAVGATVGAFLLRGGVGPETWKLAGQYTATYTGGGANFAAVGAALDTSGELFAAGIAADVIITGVWLMVCLMAPVLFARTGREEAAAPSPHAAPGSTPVAAVEDEESGGLQERLYAAVGSVRLTDLGALATIVLGCLWVSGWLGERFPLPSVIWLTTLALLLAQIPRVQGIRGAAVVGNYLILIFLASNGAKSVVANIVALGPSVVYFALVTVAIHGVIIFGIGRLVGLDLRTLAVASQANIGGPASAMAIATARGYTDKLLPGVAVGLLGYAVGNYIGLAVAAGLEGVLG